MAGNAGAAAQVANIVIQDYLENGPESGYCQYLEFVDEGPGGWNPAYGFARQLFCNPPPPPAPPSTDFFNAGGVPCRLYRVTFETGAPGGAGTVSVVDRRGPIGLIQTRGNNPDGTPTKRFTLTSGTGTGCPREAEVIAGTSNSDVVDVFARITSIVALEGTPETEIPIFRPPVQPPETDPPDFTVNIPFNVDGFEINAPINFGPLVNTPFGPVIEFTFSPTANFNPEIDITLGLNPRFGLDLNLEFVIPLTGPTSAPVPVPGAEPIPLPDVRPLPTSECEEFDYERIENAILAARCCNPITDVQSIGTFTFENSNQVAEYSVPDNTVAVFIGIVPSNNARVYKLAGPDSEYGHGNATLTSRGNALGFERLYVNNHALFFPETADTKGVRISCGKGTIITVNAGVYIPTVEM